MRGINKIMNAETIKILEDAGIKWTETLPKLLNNEQIYVKYLKRLLTNDYYERLLMMIDADECAVAFELAHTLRGTVGNLGITHMHECLVDMTEELRAGDLETARLRVPDLISAHDTAYEAIGMI